MSGKYQQIPLTREDEHEKFRLMAVAVAEGYVMVCGEGGPPIVMTIDEWVEIGGGTKPADLRAVD